MSTQHQSIKVLPWGEEVYLEIPLHKKSAHKFYARHGKTVDGREYIEFSKFGPMTNTDGEGTYSQKLRMYNPQDWTHIKDTVENQLMPSIGWEIE